MKIAIAGAGIGGLAAGALLFDRGHEVTLFDRFDAPRPVGSGLVIQPVGLDVLDEIGVGTLVRGGAAPIDRMLGHEADNGRPVLDVSYGKIPGLGIHRATLFEALLTGVRARGLTLVQNAEITGREGPHLTTKSGGKEGPFDLIVDALGAASPLSPLVSRPLPFGAIWGTVDWPEASPLPRRQLSQRYRSARNMVGVLPLGPMPGETAWKAAVFWSMPADAHDAWQQAGVSKWLSDVAALWPEALPFLGQITQPDDMTMARYSHGTMARPWGEGIVHIGDAAHRASPQLGQGANMALLDAAALARALTIAPLTDALRAYGLARRWHVRIYQGMSAAFTPQYQSESTLLPVLRDRVLFPVSRIPPIPRILSHLVSGTMLPPMASLTGR